METAKSDRVITEHKFRSDLVKKIFYYFREGGPVPYFYIHMIEVSHLNHNLWSVGYKY